MDKTYPPEAWKRLGKVLERRRGQLGYGFRERERFLRDKGGPPPSAKMLARLERGERTSYPESTLTLLESLYELVPGSFETVLAGGELELPVRTSGPLRIVPSAASDGSDPWEQVLADLVERHGDDAIVDALAKQFHKKAKMRVDEIMELLEWRQGQKGNGTVGLGAEHFLSISGVFVT